jgi:hypothetical protein
VDPSKPLQSWPLPNLDPEQLLLVVVGAHPKAEAGDRPVAGWLRDRMTRWLDGRFGPAAEGMHPCNVLVVTDVWYLNDRDLAPCPVVSVGGPGVNALSAALGGRIPSVFVIDNVLVVQLDPEFDELRACCWGMGTAQTAAAVELFVERYLDGFMEAATARWAPDAE